MSLFKDFQHKDRVRSELIVGKTQESNNQCSSSDSQIDKLDRLSGSGTPQWPAEVNTNSELTNKDNCEMVEDFEVVVTNSLVSASLSASTVLSSFQNSADSVPSRVSKSVAFVLSRYSKHSKFNSFQDAKNTEMISSGSSKSLPSNDNFNKEEILLNPEVETYVVDKTNEEDRSEVELKKSYIIENGEILKSKSIKSILSTAALTADQPSESHITPIIPITDTLQDKSITHTPQDKSITHTLQDKSITHNKSSRGCLSLAQQPVSDYYTILGFASDHK